MSYTTTWDAVFEASPSDTDLASEGAARIREERVALRERLEKDHYWDPAGTDADHGEHKTVTLRTGFTPTAEADKGKLYVKDVSEKAELFYIDEDGNEVQLTAGGVAKVTASTVLTIAYPIGSLYISTLSTNPATLLGFGTWEAFGGGRVLVGQTSADTDFDAAEKTGGEKTHLLTANESGLPSHAHAMQGSPGGGSLTLPYISTGNTVTYAPNTVATGDYDASVAHNNLQPYIVVYMWKRTA